MWCTLLNLFYVLLLFLFSEAAFADLIIKQTITSNGEVSHATQYLSGALFRLDMLTKDTEIISIIKDSTIISCQKLRDSSEKGQCTITDMAQAEAVLGMTSIKVKDHELKKLKKTGKFIGRSCEYYQRKLTLDISVMGVATLSKTLDKFCVDKSVKVPVDALVYQLISILRGTMTKKQLDEYISKEENSVGMLLYQRSQIQAKSQVKAVQSIAKVFGGDTRTNEKSTTITKTTSLKETRIPKSRFNIPTRGYEFTDFRKKSTE
jgi:hypothetical protein